MPPKKVNPKSLENLRPWQKGQSGNTSGRSKKDLDARDEARKHAAKAMQVHVRNLDAALLVETDDRSEEANATRKVGAGSATFIWEQAYGKARQNVDVTTDGEALQPITLGSVVAELRDALEAKDK